MRNRALVGALLLVAVGGGCAESVATSPECERWIADYRQKLAVSRPVQEVAKQGHTLKRYVHRQIAQAPHKPTLVKASLPRDPLRPKMTPQQMLRRFQVLCGDLPPVETAQLLTPVDAPAAPLTRLNLPASPATPATTPATSLVPTGSPMFPGGPGSPGTPGGGGGGGTPPPVGPPTGPPTGPPDVPPPPTGPPTEPPAPPVPEPSSFVLVLTGSLLAMGYAVRKLG